MKWIVLAIVAYFVYRAWQSQSSETVANDDTLTEPLVNSRLQTQPQQKYYVQPAIDPRVDGVDQPWYNSGRGFMGVAGGDILEGSDSGGISSYDTKSFWAELGSRYSH